MFETVLTIALSATLLAPVVEMLRTCRQGWDETGADRERQAALLLASRHISRGLREADRISRIRLASVHLYDQEDVHRQWDYDVRWDQIVYRKADSDANALTDPFMVDSAVFRGYRSNGTTTTTTVNLVHSVEFELSTTLNRGSLARFNLKRRVWLRNYDDWERKL